MPPKQQILVIHGGNAFNTYEEYLDFLKNMEPNSEWLKFGSFKNWKKSLKENLGENFEVFTPQMPNASNAKYTEWKIWFEKLVPFLMDNIILVGHSLGGIFLAKYLSEEIFSKKIKAVFLVAAPFNTKTEHPLADFIISTPFFNFEKQAGEIFIYHSKEDEVVPFSNFESYKKLLPKAHVRIFENKGHFNHDEFPEIIEDIKNLI